MDKEDEESPDMNTVSFEVIQEQIETLQKRYDNLICVCLFFHAPLPMGIRFVKDLFIINWN